MNTKIVSIALSSILFFLGVASEAHLMPREAPLKPSEQHLYAVRHFVELEHLLSVTGREESARLIQAQQKDLVGCNQVHQGRASTESIAMCMGFVEREDKMGLKSDPTLELAADLDRLCSQMLIHDEDALPFLRHSLNLQNRRWRKCNIAVGKQIYNHTYAELGKNPAAELATIRWAQKNLGIENPWLRKSLQLFDRAPIP